MVSLSAVLPAMKTKTSGLKKCTKGFGLGTLATAGFCLLDFTNVPGAFGLKYDTDGEKVEGTNWSSGLKELAKSAVKCAGYLAVPAAILGMASGAGIVVAGIAGLASMASGFALGSLYEKYLPHEQELVAAACEKKGISLTA